MHAAFDNIDASYFNETDLEKIHLNIKEGALLKVSTSHVMLPHFML